MAIPDDNDDDEDEMEHQLQQDMNEEIEMDELNPYVYNILFGTVFIFLICMLSTVMRENLIYLYYLQNYTSQKCAHSRQTSDACLIQYSEDGSTGFGGTVTVSRVEIPIHLTAPL